MRIKIIIKYCILAACLASSVSILSSNLHSPFVKTKLNANMNKLYGTTPEHDGPNCFNAAFYATEIYPYRFFTSTVQTNYLFESACKEVSSSKAVLGTIVRYINKESGIDSHAAIYSSKGSYFQKLKEFAYMSPYESVNEMQMIQSLELDSNCAASQSCLNQKRFYNCSFGFKDSLKPKDSFERSINLIANEISAISFENTTSTERINRIKMEASSLNNILNNTSTYNKDRIKFWDYLLLDISRQSYYYLGTLETSSKEAALSFKEAKVSLDNFIVKYFNNRLKRGIIIPESEYNEFVDLLNVSRAKPEYLLDLSNNLKPTRQFSKQEQIFMMITGNNQNFGTVDNLIFPFLESRNKTNLDKVAGLESFFNNSKSRVQNISRLTDIILSLIKNRTHQQNIGIKFAIKTSYVDLGAQNLRKINGALLSREPRRVVVNSPANSQVEIFQNANIIPRSKPLKDFFRDGPKVASHRGGGHSVRKNTIVQFEEALMSGADIIETDLRLTKDGVVVIYHDKKLSKKTRCKGSVKTKTFKELRECRFKNNSQKIPSFKEVLKWANGRVVVNAEFKTKGVIIPALRAMREENALERVYFQTRSKKSRYEKARGFDKEAHLLVEAKSKKDIDWFLKRNDSQILGVEINGDLVRKDIVEHIQKNGKLVSGNSFLSDTNKEKESANCSLFLGLGFDIIVTDQTRDCTEQRRLLNR